MARDVSRAHFRPVTGSQGTLRVLGATPARSPQARKSLLSKILAALIAGAIGPPARYLSDMTPYFQFPQSPLTGNGISKARPALILYPVFLYPHAVTGVLSSSGRNVIRRNPAYLLT